MVTTGDPSCDLRTPVYLYGFVFLYGAQIGKYWGGMIRGYDSGHDSGV